MKRGKHKGESRDELRGRAEAQLRVDTGRMMPSPISADALRQLHELQVHQIELEMQNQELQRIRDELESSLERYTELYDFAPSGYLSLDPFGTILELNLSAATLLGPARSNLVGRQFAAFIAVDCRPVFSEFLTTVFFTASGATAIDVMLPGPSTKSRFIHLQGIADSALNRCRLVLLDITEREQANHALRQTEQHARALVAQNRALTRRMFTMEESERREIARELHDELGQWLTGINAEAEAILNVPAEVANPRTKAGAIAIRNGTDQIQQMIRRMLHRLRPSLLDTLGLGDNLRDLVAEWQRRQPAVQYALMIDADAGALTSGPAIAVYRIVQEGLNNVTRHARARHVRITLRRRAPTPDHMTLRLTIEDDGVGMDTTLPRAGLGLMGMRERAIAAGGELFIDSAPHCGVSIVANLPLE